MYDETEKMLTIEGYCKMNDFGDNNQDWKEEMQKATTIIIGNPITTIGSNAFLWTLSVQIKSNYNDCLY